MPPGVGSVMPSHRVRQQHPELFTEAIVLHARQVTPSRPLKTARSGQSFMLLCAENVAVQPMTGATHCGPTKRSRCGHPPARCERRQHRRTLAAW